MKSERLKVNSKQSLSAAISRLGALFSDHKYLTVSVRIGKDRTIDQNALWFAMYQRISEMSGMGATEECRAYCKLHFGVPIMRRDDDEFRAGWDSLIRHLPYEEKLRLMGACALFGPDGFPVTRLFNRKQGIEYTETIANVLGAQGVYFDDLLDDR